ncbi:MAG TPA: class II fructose-bisphosphate aldolase [Anaerolineae bacterium]|nr:class II fructose-bisphosphate aldolase [Anaerolineae bacterium]
MSIIRNYNQVKEIYQEAGEREVGLPLFCCEDRQSLEAILAAAYEIGQEIGIPNIPIIPAWTSRYHVRGQAALVSKTNDARIGCQLMFSDLKIFTGENSPYKDLLVMPHLDHAFPWVDGDILLDFADQFASVMCDASEKPLDENIKLTAEYVEKVKGKVIVEGAVDEISSTEGGLREKKTTIEEAERFVRETGVDIIVPNVGTEHRSTKASASYDSELTRQLSGAVGKILCLHGSSSIKREDLPKLPKDGVIKINLYTALAYASGKAVVEYVIDNVGNVFRPEELEELVKAGKLGRTVLNADYADTILPVGPKLTHFTNPLRRDVWFNTFKEKCKDYMYQFNYENFSKQINLI